MSKIYKVTTRFIFEGTFKVVADSKEEARRSVLEDCGMTIGGGIHSTMPDDEIDWDFPCHPDQKIVSVK
ncbi:hypothetical protein [Bacteroides timonensis]|uniref:hypothetical protein n=1 Tax=Bacteroides timonensis TaxID=1470345 RepID=UPI0004AEA176|nr:hypothetical protein [Bacteroides timonensis]